MKYNMTAAENWNVFLLLFSAPVMLVVVIEQMSLKTSYVMWLMSRYDIFIM